MPKAVVTYVRCIGSVNAGIGKVIGYSFLVLITVMLIESIARTGFNNPQTWTIELSLFLLAGYYAMAGGYTLLMGGHVNMDLLYNRWSVRRRAITDAITFALLAVFLVVFILGGINSIQYAVGVGQHTQSTWGPIMAPIKIAMTVGGILLLLQAIASFVKDLAIIRGRPIT